MTRDLTLKKARIAPTPSGYLHLGNVLSFAITAALAQKYHAKLFLRIDDVDRERTNMLYVQDIFDTLNFLEIPWDEGPRNIQEYEQEYSQMRRMDIYNGALDKLKESGAVFACTCSRADVLKLSRDNIYQGTCRHKHLPLDAQNVTLRLFTDGTTPLVIKTLQEEDITTTLPATMSDFVVRKRDGFPAYQLTSLMDDIHFGIDLVVRGEDLWPSTLAQHYLSLRLGLEAFRDIAFFHHPLLLDADGHKLSKSLEAPSVQYFRKQHKKAEDIYALISGILGVDVKARNWQELVTVLKLI
jgi:glutamyl/glutaminyl-tRNA synthetase